MYLGDSPYVVRAVRRTDRGSHIAFEGVDDRASAEEIRGAIVSVARRRELAEGEYWPEQLVGLDVFDQAGNEVGVVEGVINGPGQDRLLVKGSGGAFEIPFVDALVPVVDLDKRRIEIVAIPGLIDGT